MNPFPGRVSVVIPAYRAEGTICRAIDSVLAQTIKVEEIIVVDDGSPDDLAGMVQRTYGDRVILIQQANGKTAKARNTGIERASGDFIAFLDADDYWESDKIEKQLQVFHAHPDVGLVAGRFYNQEPGQPGVAGTLRPGLEKYYDRALRVQGADAFLVTTLVWTGMVMIRRQSLGEERFVSGLEPAEDRDLWFRIVENSAVYLSSEPLATAVLVPDSLSRSGIEKDCNNMLRVVDRHSHSIGPVVARQWRAYTLFRWGANEPNPCHGLLRLLQSFVLWPLPFWRIPTMPRLGRVKRFLVTIKRIITNLLFWRGGTQ